MSKSKPIKDKPSEEGLILVIRRIKPHSKDPKLTNRSIRA